MSNAKTGLRTEVESMSTAKMGGRKWKALPAEKARNLGLLFSGSTQAAVLRKGVDERVIRSHRTLPVLDGFSTTDLNVIIHVETKLGRQLSEDRARKLYRALFVVRARTAMAQAMGLLAAKLPANVHRFPVKVVTLAQNHLLAA